MYFISLCYCQYCGTMVKKSVDTSKTSAGINVKLALTLSDPLAMIKKACPQRKMW